jgi:TonB family protein
MVPRDRAAPARGLLVQTSFRGVVIGACVLTARPIRDRSRPRARRRERFVIGSNPGVDAPTPLSDQRSAHTLVTLGEHGAVLSLAAGMRAEVADEQGHAIRSVQPDAPRALKLHPRESASVAFGEATFHVTPTEVPPALPRPRWGCSLRDHGYSLAAVLLLLAAVGAGLFVPSDPHARSFDLSESTRRVAIAITIPPRPPEPPAVAAGGAHSPGSKPTPVARTASGKRATSIGTGRTRGPLLAPSRGDPTKAGLLALLDARRDPAMAALLGRESALGEASERVLAELGAGGDGFEAGGLGVAGTGTSHTGTHERLLGTGKLGTMGACVREPCGAGPGSTYGRHAARLGARTPRGLEVQAGAATVRGQLDKEIVGRVIRRHLNEVRFCYEKELGWHQDLGGRMLVELTIAANGQVVAAVIAAGLGRAPLDACVAAAVRRWEFPAPEAGGLVVVRYPFVFTPAGT